MEKERDVLTRALLSLQTPEECDALLDDMCTIKEIEDMSHRLMIAVLLAEGKTFIDVEKQTGASSATISRVNKCLKHGTGYRTVIQRILDGKTIK
ncbi:YerC/YecD family TrpR-related protein [Pseudoramibacter sp.]|jgi:TrpR-related protein YerC/YecD|uniref:YerC/YecD family TrpR-related protein n=1 Tax=Pseudoramibacter sp. TaxID=2034862 RepID=UPI0025FDFEE1|nr:YerC/YecD family TrpR-related protein [Pseudoramibacter sp.]MCH4071439.1 YerC/YecD family TrpR-related protein [Pseudoramibacter sp.]MCH4105207.1 YerC/YecD family TrpR-related protein [Pseudoramibacter sp.]